MYEFDEMSRDVIKQDGVQSVYAAKLFLTYNITRIRLGVINVLKPTKAFSKKLICSWPIYCVVIK